MAARSAATPCGGAPALPVCLHGVQSIVYTTACRRDAVACCIADTDTKHVLALTELQFGHEQTMCQWKCVPHDWLRPRDAGWVGCQSCMCIHNMRLDFFEANKEVKLAYHLRS